MTINIILAPVPNTKAVVTKNDDGSYSVIVSKSLSQEQARQEVLHELGHIVGEDFGKDIQANLIEEMIRRSNIISSKVAEGMEFYYHSI